MLVEIHRGLIKHGYSVVDTYAHWWSRAKPERKEISVHTGISGICDESEIEETIIRLLNIEMHREGWGENFEGWTSYEWTSELSIKYIKNMYMTDIVRKLTGEQFQKEFLK